jgi:hypothetical protein
MISRDLKKSIKYRVWHEGCFYYWGFLNNVFIEPPGICGEYADIVERKSQQFTGLRDKNGNEIYVGDIIDISSMGIRNKRFYIVSSVFGFGEDFGIASRFWENSSCVVIGNVYEHPEILSLATRR